MSVILPPVITPSAGLSGPPGLAGELDILAFAEAELTAGRKAALATIVALDGPFSRPLGAQLAVASDRRFVGSISGGCLEAALTEEATQALKTGENARLRYGAGSPYHDVRLPCGGGLDIALDVSPDPDVLRDALERGRNREPFSLAFDPNSTRSTLRLLRAGEQAKPNEFVRPFTPRLRILLAGRGWEIVAMARQARTYDCEIVVASQEQATLDYCKPFADRLIHLTIPAMIPQLPLDADTAVACLFHEHQWEGGILKQALESPAFYVGALGSKKTHDTRLEVLDALGVAPENIARLKGPIGIFASRDPGSLAVSALAEILGRRLELRGSP